MNNGYPPGTRCVITWPSPVPACTVCVGDVYEVGEVKLPGAPCVALSTGRKGHAKRTYQHLVGASGGRPGARLFWPVDWMRPIDEDTDAEDEETVAAYEKAGQTTRPAVESSHG
jgi:hypothetical protein